MKIALLCGRLGAGSGTGGQAESLAAELAGRGHEVAVWCRRVDRAPQGVAVHVVRSRRGLAGAVPPGFLKVGLDRVPGCDVVRASGGVHRAWSRRSASTLFRGMATLRPRELLEARRDRAAAVGARIVICNSQRAAGEVMSWHGVGPDRVRVVRNAVDLDRFRPDPSVGRAARQAWGVPPRGRVALFLGHGWHRKGLDAAVAAFVGAAGPDDRLVVMGSDAHASGYLRRAADRVGDRLVAVGAGDPSRWLPGADVLLHPTRYDASANAVLEAMAAGVPPVTTLADGAAELVPDRALVVGDPDDVEGLVAAIRYAWEGDPGSGARCRRAAEAWPGSRIAGAVEGILEELDG